MSAAVLTRLTWPQETRIRFERSAIESFEALKIAARTLPVERRVVMFELIARVLSPNCCVRLNGRRTQEPYHESGMPDCGLDVSMGCQVLCRFQRWSNTVGPLNCRQCFRLAQTSGRSARRSLPDMHNGLIMCAKRTERPVSRVREQEYSKSSVRQVLRLLGSRLRSQNLNLKAR